MIAVIPMSIPINTIWQYFARQMVDLRQFSQLINRLSIPPLSMGKPGSVTRQWNRCSTAKPKKQLRKINGPSDS